MPNTVDAKYKGKDTNPVSSLKGSSPSKPGRYLTMDPEKTTFPLKTNSSNKLKNVHEK